MGKYGQIAVVSAKLAQITDDPERAWDLICGHVFGRESSGHLKGCPKGTFLGLCSAGKIVNIPKGDYTESKKNKNYALEAVKILPTLPELFDMKELWEDVLKASGENLDKQHNEQMDVVMMLWEEGLINA